MCLFSFNRAYIMACFSGVSLTLIRFVAAEIQLGRVLRLHPTGIGDVLTTLALLYHCLLGVQSLYSLRNDN